MGDIICHRYWRTGAPSSGLYLGHKGIFLRTVGMIYFVLRTSSRGGGYALYCRLAPGGGSGFNVLGVKTAIYSKFTDPSRVALSSADSEGPYDGTMI